jgi:hypothetical protein
MPPDNGRMPTAPPCTWFAYPPDALAPNGQGEVDLTIGGANTFTLTDNYFICRYKPHRAPLCSGDAGSGSCTNDPALGWSAWSNPMLAEGWIKRVLARINPFEQRYTNYHSSAVNTTVSMISQAGKRWIGNIPLDAATANNYGLIEIYKTVLNHGEELSINGNPAIQYGPADDALLLAASRLAELYMLLGNEAYADASDPTVGIIFDPSTTVSVQNPSIHAFQNQTASYLEEELDLLRGRDDGALTDRADPNDPSNPLNIPAPSVQAYPVYNHLYWNITHDILGGEVAYKNKYNIQPLNGDLLNGATAMYPQGHGDAWGHYLSALKGYYSLLRNPNFTWIPRAESVLVGGQPIPVDYYDERLFARAAAALARTGADVAELTYRSYYVDDPNSQWQGYLDSNTNRAWGVSEWGMRAGQSALFNWIVANGILPDVYQPGYRITDSTLASIGANQSYNLTAAIITNVIGPGAVAAGITATNIGNTSITNGGAINGAISATTISNLLRYAVGQYQGRAAFLNALDSAIGADQRTLYEDLILSSAQTTNGVPEAAYGILAELNGTQYPSLSNLTAIIEAALSTNVFNTIYTSQVPPEVFAAYYTNQILPYVQIPSAQQATGIQKIDRSTVPELNDISSAFMQVQGVVDNADNGLNPLGLAKNTVPFDLDENQINQGITHFEQIYSRALMAMNNAMSVFNYANNLTLLLQRQTDTIQQFQQKISDQENDFTNRLIEIFGYPYPEDIGPGGTYPLGYQGPDTEALHYNYVDTDLVTGLPSPTNVNVQVNLFTPTVDPTTGALSNPTNPVTLSLSSEGVEFAKPTGWSSRPAPGDIQRSINDLLGARVRFYKALQDYNNLLGQIDDQADLLQTQYGVNADELQILNDGRDTAQNFNIALNGLKASELVIRGTVNAAVNIANAAAQFPPTVVGLADDVTSAARGGLALGGAIASTIANAAADTLSIAEMGIQSAKEDAQTANSIRITTLHQGQGITNQIVQLQQLVRQEAPLRYELFSQREAVLQAAGNYQSTVAKGLRLIADRTRFRTQTADQITDYRYKDMAFRIFRDDAIQIYRAQFDLAARYVYLAAKAYDYDTNLRPGDPAYPGTNFFRQIVQAQAIGQVENGVPQVGNGSIQDPGLADIMARMNGDFANLKGQLGINNPQTNVLDFSLRTELLRISPAATNSLAAWHGILAQSVVPDLNQLDDFKRYTLFSGNSQPAIVLQFPTTVATNVNFFGWPYGPGDHQFNDTAFATKIKTVSVVFYNYRTGQTDCGAMGASPQVYLFPIGYDVMRCPRAVPGDNINYVRDDWKVLDQWLPIPYPLSGSSDALLSTPGYIPLNTLVAGQSPLGAIRAYGSFPASLGSPSSFSSRLVSRSVWNTSWLLVIPAANLNGFDYNEGINRFIYGGLTGPNCTGTQRDGNGVLDIHIVISAYSYYGR